MRCGRSGGVRRRWDDLWSVKTKRLGRRGGKARHLLGLRWRAWEAGESWGKGLGGARPDDDGSGQAKPELGRKMSFAGVTPSCSATVGTTTSRAGSAFGARPLQGACMRNMLVTMYSMYSMW